MIPAHWIKPNETSRLPACFLYLDTEAATIKRKKQEVQTFRLAAAGHDHRREGTWVWREPEYATFTDTEELWTWLLGKVKKRERSVLLAHNLAYDLRVSRALFTLPERGWTFHRGRLDSGRAWMTWRLGSRTLLMLDTMSWVPRGLDHLADLVGIHKPPLPKQSAPVGTWLERCEADVQILRAVWQRVVNWLHDEDLGSFAQTGAGQAWKAWRHRFYDVPVLVHREGEAKESEREAAWTGRCEAWRHGELGVGPWWEWDFESAYARIALECNVPTAYRGNVGPLTQPQRFRLHQRQRVLHHCEVTTELPLVPARVGKGIGWPVGTFETTLWDTEVKLLVEKGQHVRTLSAQTYRMGPALRSWATWTLAQLERKPTDLDPVIRLVLKHWSRSLIGRFGVRSFDWEPYGESEASDVSTTKVLDLDTAETWLLLQLGKDQWRSVAQRDGYDAAPQVMSWIMAEMRVRLWRAIEAAGLDHVVYMDTDGLIVDRTGNANLKAAGIANLRVKGKHAQLTVLGPRQVIASGQVRAAGVPSRASRRADGNLVYDSWSQLPGALARKEADRVTITERVVHLRGTDNRRAHLPGGRTEAVKLG